MIYERGRLPLDVLFDSRQLLFSAAFLVVSLVLALAVGRRLVRFATTISPLEASRRVSQSEVSEAALRFGPLQALALALGRVHAGHQLDDGSGAVAQRRLPVLRDADRLLDFLGLPLVLYGVATLLASKRHGIQRVLSVLIRPIARSARRLCRAASRREAAPHRRVSADRRADGERDALSDNHQPIVCRQGRARRARAAWRRLAGAVQLAGAGRRRRAARVAGRSTRCAHAGRGIDGRRASGRCRASADATYLYEAVLPQFYLPGYGLKGVPMFLIGEPDRYLQRAYAEPVLGLSDRFNAVMEPLSKGQVAVSPPVADFWKIEPGLPLLVGMDHNRAAIGATASGVLAYLPGIPPRSVTDRQGYVQARIDYLNHLFNSNSYVVSAARNPELARTELLIPRVIVLAWGAEGASTADTERALIAALPVPLRSKYTICRPRRAKSAPTCSSRWRSPICAST